MKQIIFFDMERISEEDKIKYIKWDLKAINNNYKLSGVGIDSFFESINQLKGDLRVYVWELEYEGKYIEYYLFRNGYEYESEQKLTKPKSFTILMNGDRNYYFIKIRREDNIITFFSLRHKYGNRHIEEISKSYKIKSSDKIKIMEKVIKYSWGARLYGLTAGSDSMSTYKKMVGKEEFVRDYPKISKDEDKYLREAYKGGIVYIKKTGEWHFVKVYDINSAYGSVLYDSELPYGRGEYFEGQYKPDNVYKLYVQKIKVKCRLKKDMIPFINLKKQRTNKDIRTDEKGNLISTRTHTTLILTNYEIEHFFKNYNVTECIYIDGMKWRSSNDKFKDYISYYYDLKQMSDYRSAIAKSMIVNLYGKFGTKSEREQIRLTYDKNNDLITTYAEEEECPLVYLPVAVFVTSALRAKMLTEMEKFAKHGQLLYADTDSIHICCGEYDIKNPSDKLGDFKLEAFCPRVKYLGRKKYCYEYFDDTGKWTPDNCKTKSVLAGFSLTDDGLKYSEFERGVVVDTKYFKSVRGGTIIAQQCAVI